MNWGTEWDDKKQETTGKAIVKRQAEAGTIDFGNGAVKTEIVKVDKETVTVLEYYEKERTNKVPTHDPYTNPGAHVYYSCKCGQILDPGTKSFSQLNNAASEAGWKIRFGDQHYEAHCVECGKEVE